MVFLASRPHEDGLGVSMLLPQGSEDLPGQPESFLSGYSIGYFENAANLHPC